MELNNSVNAPSHALVFFCQNYLRSVRLESEKLAERVDSADAELLACIQKRKLEQTEDNLLRIKDMIVALEEQVGPLEEQSRKARTYLDLRESLKGLDVNIAINNIDRA